MDWSVYMVSDTTPAGISGREKKGNTVISDISFKDHAINSVEIGFMEILARCSNTYSVFILHSAWDPFRNYVFN